MLIDNEIIKKTKNNGIIIIKEVANDTAKKIILENHYSKTWNTSMGIINFGVFKNNKLYGVASFGNLMNPESYKNITPYKNSVIELNRLWIDDILKKNIETILISSSFKIIKKQYPEIKHIQSFADGRLGCGTIYKAANFKYIDYSLTKFFINYKTNEFYHKVLLENTKRPISFLNKNRLFIDGVLKACFVKTYRYIYDLYKKYPSLLESNPYPPYEKNLEFIDNYQHSLSLLCRLYLMYKLIGDNIYSYKCIKLLRKYEYSSTEIIKETKEQKNNKSYIWFRDKYVKSEDLFLTNKNLYKKNENKLDFLFTN